MSSFVLSLCRTRSFPARRSPSGSGARRVGLLGVVLGCSLFLSCRNVKREETEEQKFSVVALDERAAFMAVHGTSGDDVWAVGADDGSGPVVLHYGDEGITRYQTGLRGDLWWVHALKEDSVYFGGSDSHVVHYDGETFERLSTPGLGKHIVFGVWASAKDDLYAVGAEGARNGFIWHYDGNEFREISVPLTVRESDSPDVPPFFKVVGVSADDVWVVGGEGTVLRGNSRDGFEQVPSGTDEQLFTVHASGDEVVIVGGSQEGVVLTFDTSDPDAELRETSPSDASLLQGAFVDPTGDDWLSGRDGKLYVGGPGGFSESSLKSNLDVQSLHAIWKDPEGGNVLSGSLDAGAVITTKPRVELWQAEFPSPEAQNTCPEAAIDLAPSRSIARQWNEQMLAAIRRDLPRPTVHARNLLHVSIAMWDAWAAYDDVAQGVIVDEARTADDLEAERREAVSYAAYRVLSHRYAPAIGGALSKDCFDAFMMHLGFDPEATGTSGDSARAFGNRVGEAVISSFSDDGSNEENDYADPEGFSPDQPLLIVAEPGTLTEDPTQWQEILLAEAVTQNGIPESSGVRPYIGAHWGEVTPFSLERSSEGEPYYTGRTPPTELDDDLVDAAVQIIRKGAELDFEDGEMMDISPAGYGNNPLGTDDGEGRPENPVTQEPYEEELVLRGDFARILAEFWADGPASETPPGHWNTLANLVADHPDVEYRLFGEGEELDALSWDVHVYLALNGAVHDAAIAAWEVKRNYTSARPITLIRYLCQLGQRTDPDGPSYHESGVPLEPGLIEVITEESSARGERHEHLVRYIGEIAVRAWRGEPGDRKSETGGVEWIRGSEWIPYQRRTFVTPAFPGYVSGHSTFSRAAAVVLAELTGSEYFPGGLATKEVEPGYLVFEYGPSEPVTLQWATYFDAADQAGQSRLWGGIHIRNDDYDGRVIGADVGARALELAEQYYEGTAP
jgi:hypothetical protein